jgi:hypothetical protein
VFLVHGVDVYDIFNPMLRDILKKLLYQITVRVNDADTCATQYVLINQAEIS